MRRLCDDEVYYFGAARAECEEIQRRLLEQNRLRSVSVESVVLEGDAGTAYADVTTMSDEGTRRTSRYTFQLVKRRRLEDQLRAVRLSHRAGAWRSR